MLAFYDGFEVGTSYFNNSISYLKWHSQRSWNQLLESQLEWPTEDISYTVNAAYAPTRNQIYITAGISQAPFFDPSLPEYLNYGQLGYTSGHELTHGFDNTGHNYDQTGLLKKTWDNETEASFLNLTQCFVDQVDGFDLHVDYPTAGAPAVDAKTNQTLYANGTMSLGENIADNGGIVTSFAAWSKRKDRDVNNLKLPGLDQFTIEQLFFVAAGQFWCHNTDLDSLATNVATDVHAPAEARIRTIAENSRGFRDAFNCKKKEPVCELW